MPSRSQAQHNLMAMVAHDPKAAKRLKIPQSVGKEFVSADKGKKFAKGGIMATKMFKGKETPAEEMKEAKALKSGKISAKQYVAGEKSEGHKEENVAKQAKAIKSGKMSPAAYAKSEKMEKYARGGGIEVRGKTKGTMVKMCGGGMMKKTGRGR